MSYKCEIVEKAEQPVLSIRTRTPVGDLPAVMGQSFGTIGAYLGELGEHPTGMPFAGYFNMDMQNLDVELGMPVARQLPGKGDIQASKIPGGKQATCVHTGPYNTLEAAYGALQKFVAESGYEATGVAYEVYLNDPGVVPEEEIQTQIIFPLHA